MASAAAAVAPVSAEENPLSCLADDFVEEGPSESRIAAATVSSSASSKPLPPPHKSLAEAPEYVRRAPPPLSKDSDEYWLARAQRRAHQQPPSQPSADGTAASRVKDRRARAPRVKKGRRGGVFMRWMLDTFHLKEQLLASNAAVVAAAASSPHSVAAGVSSAAASVASPSASAAALSSAPPPSPSPSFPHLVDVAGGRGQVAFMLCAFHGMRVSVIDPVDMSLGIRRYSVRYHQQRVQNSWQSRQARERGAQQELPALQLQLASSSASSEPVLLPSGIHLPVPWLPSLQHFQCMFPDSISLSLHKQYARPSPSPVAPSPSPSTSASSASDSTAATGEESASEDEAVQDFDADEGASFCCASDDAARSPSAANDIVGAELMSSSVLASTLSSCALLYGMHADGATEALVDYALAHDKPFAVVPCCVFPGAAPHRRVRRRCEPSAADPAASTEPSDVAHAVAADEWVPVRSYDQFLDYLQAKHPSIQRANLSFEGRNTVLYRTVDNKDD